MLPTPRENHRMVAQGGSQHTLECPLGLHLCRTEVCSAKETNLVTATSHIYHHAQQRHWYLYGLFQPLDDGSSERWRGSRRDFRTVGDECIASTVIVQDNINLIRLRLPLL